MHLFLELFFLFRERFAFPLPFSDGHGKLALSAKQRQKLTRWARPEEFIREPTMIQLGKQNQFCTSESGSGIIVPDLDLDPRPDLTSLTA